MYNALLIFFLLISILLIGCIMLQQGKGADAATSFGASASTSLFGSNGSGNFMTRMTAVLATLFFIISLVLGSIVSNKNSEWENLNQPVKSKQMKKEESPVNKPATTDIPQ